MELDIQKKMVCRSGMRSEMLRRDREAGSWLHGHTRAWSGVGVVEGGGREREGGRAGGRAGGVKHALGRHTGVTNKPRPTRPLSAAK